MSTPKATVEAFLRALEAFDTTTAADLLADDVVYQNVPFPADRGKQAVLATLSRFQKLVSRFEVRMVNIAAEGDIVLTERVDVLSGALVHFEIWVCGTFEVKDGKITLWRDYFDLAQVTSQLFTGRLRKAIGL